MIFYLILIIFLSCRVNASALFIWAKGDLAQDR
jgi:hypothetical protein